MEDNYFSEQNKVFELKGILGRRGFLINFLIVKLVESLILTTPVIYLLILKPQIWLASGLTLTDTNGTLWTPVWVAVVGVITSAIFFPSIIRRTRDIVGEVDDNKIFMISAILTVICFASYTPIGTNFLCRWFSLLSILILLFKKGKITSQKPENNLYKFNWGAFFGTWIWGLFNRVKQTAWMLPLCLTCGWFLFMLICGLKGNEWVSQNTTIDDMEKFHKSQENQAIIWSILGPILLIAGFATLSITSGIAVAAYSNSHPEFRAKLENFAVQYQKTSTETNFAKIVLNENENKFYLQPENWAKLSDKYKKRVFDLAADYVSISKNNEVKNIKTHKTLYDIEIMNKTKIYSTFNDEILAEFYLNPTEYSKKLQQTQDLKEILSIINIGYKLNNYPTTP